MKKNSLYIDVRDFKQSILLKSKLLKYTEKIKLRRNGSYMGVDYERGTLLDPLKNIIFARRSRA